MIISQIAAASLNNVIGKDNALPWNMPTDMSYFKQKTLGHHIITGRRNYEAEGRALPGRKNIILTRDQNYRIPDGLVVHLLDDAVEMARQAGEEELFIIGGAEIYKLAMPISDRIYLTRIHAEVDGDTFYPAVDEEIWQQVSIEEHRSDEKNPFDYDFIVYKRKDDPL